MRSLSRFVSSGACVVAAAVLFAGVACSAEVRSQSEIVPTSSETSVARSSTEDTAGTAVESAPATTQAAAATPTTTAAAEDSGSESDAAESSDSEPRDDESDPSGETADTGSQDEPEQASPEPDDDEASEDEQAEDSAEDQSAAEDAETDAASDEPASQVDRVLSLFNALTVTAERGGGYDRDLFKHWVDADGDGCDARREVLIAEAVVAPSVGSRCVLSGGEWLSRYDGKTTSGNGSGFDVDHMVPLAEAWESGAHGWTPTRREEYANDLGYADSLIAVSASSNRSKGARDPAEWMPPTQGVHCWYAAAWVQVKTRWSLTVDQAEADKLNSVLSGCDDAELDDVPQAQSVAEATEADEPEDTEAEPVNDCHPAYDPCLPNRPGDAFNCGDLTNDQKPVRIKKIGVDPYKLDRDKDGWGCAS